MERINKNFNEFKNRLESVGIYLSDNALSYVEKIMNSITEITHLPTSTDIGFLFDVAKMVQDEYCMFYNEEEINSNVNTEDEEENRLKNIIFELLCATKILSEKLKNKEVA